MVCRRHHCLPATPSCLWCPLEISFLLSDAYLFAPDLLAFVALKALRNNHYNLLVIRFFAFRFELFALLPLSDFPSFAFRFCRFGFWPLPPFGLRLQGSDSTDSHQLGFTDVSFRFVSLTAPSSSSVSSGSHTAAPRFQVFSTSYRVLAFFRLVGLFRPTGTWRVPVFRVLRYIRSASVSSALCFPRCCCPFSAFFLGLRGLPCPVATSLSCAATSLRLGPSSSVSLGPVSVLRFSSASELCSRLSRASLAAQFHPRAALALSPDLLFSL